MTAKYKLRLSLSKLIRRFTPDFSDIDDNNEVESLVKRTQIIANFIVMLQVLSIFVAVLALIINIISASNQKKLANNIEKNKNAVEAVGKIYNQTFLSNYNTFMEYDTISDELIQPFYYLLNTYYLIAIIYNRDIANKEIIKKSIENGILSFVERKYYTSLAADSLFTPVLLEIQTMTNSFIKGQTHEK